MTFRLPFFVAIWLIIALALTAASLGLNRLFPVEHGLVRSVYSTVRLRGEPLVEETTTSIDLAFLDESPELPSRFFGVRWRGYWFVPRTQMVDLLAGGDDRLDLFIDGTRVLRRSAADGMHTVARTLTLGAGAHEIAVEFQQHGGRSHVNVQWAPHGEDARALNPHQLFPTRIGFVRYWYAQTLRWLSRLVPVIWLAGLAALLPAVAIQAARRTRRQPDDGAPRTLADFRRRVLLVAVPALLAPVELFLLGPYTIYRSNPGEFSVPFLDMVIPWLLAPAAVTWAILVSLGAVASLISRRLVHVLAALFLAIGLVLWGQGNLMVGDYGLLDGTDIDWQRQQWRVPYELAVWTVVPLAAVVFRRAIGRVATFAVLLFLVLQSGAAAVLSLGASAEHRVRWQEPPAALYQFASRQNIVHIVLDEFQSDVLGELVERDGPWFDRRFGGFTYFADHLGAFPTTSLAMPAMLTGRDYRNRQPVRQFVRRAFGEASVFGELAERGYEIHTASILPGPWLTDWFGSAEAPGKSQPVRFTIRKPFVSRGDYRRFGARQLVELSAFRHAPHVVKPVLSASSDVLASLFGEDANSETEARRHEASNSRAFFRQYIDRVTVGLDRPAYKLIHLGIPHRPVVLDETCSFLGVVEFSREAYRGQARCAVRLVASFLDRLRELEIYDSSLIIVSSDHGTDLEPRGFSPGSGSLPSHQGASTPRLRDIVGTALTIMMIKPLGGSGPLVISHAPTMHADFPATLFDLLGLPHEYPGESMFRRDPADARRRAYAMYDVAQRFPEGHLSRLDVLSVEGRVLDGAAWKYSHSILPPDLDLRAHEIDPGAPQAAVHLGPGWSRGTTESIDDSERVTYAWGLGEQAVLFVSLSTGASRLIARLRSVPGAGAESIQVEVDDRVVGRWRPGDGAAYRDYSLRIPPDPERPPVSSIRFRFVPQNSDTYVGVKFDRIRFE